MKRSVVPGMKGDNGWDSVFYVAKDGEKTKLAQLRRTHAHKMCDFGSFEKETATATKVKSELAARARPRSGAGRMLPYTPRPSTC